MYAPSLSTQETAVVGRLDVQVHKVGMLATRRPVAFCSPGSCNNKPYASLLNSVRILEVLPS